VHPLGNFCDGIPFIRNENEKGITPLRGSKAVVEREAWSGAEVGGFTRPVAMMFASEGAASGGSVVAYFGPDLDDSVVRRRVSQWRHAGFKVLPLAFSRNSAARRGPQEFVNLGHVMPLSRARRVMPLVLAAWRVMMRRQTLSGVDLFIARNLDIALLALFARWVSGSSAPLIYEVLDINQSCSEPGWRGAFFRWIERRVLASTALLVVSSPYFATDYYEGLLRYRRQWFLFENKIPKSIGPPPPEPRTPTVCRDPKRRWVIGLFGYLDDEKSWEILRGLAEALPDKVAVYVRGTPYTNFDMTRFLADVERLENVTYGGPYRNPEDLADVYGAVDIVWSMDFNSPNSNSKWLLTNGLYEAGYFGKPVLGLRGTAVGQVLESWGSGWCLAEPVETAVIDFVRRLTVEQYEAKRHELGRLTPDLFMETNEIERIWLILRGQEARQETPAAPQQLQAM
jgi:succinoglycan biosynthesis protein ExoL